MAKTTTTMKTITLHTLALLFFVVGAASAQIPRTINYQGRAADSGGPLTGSRQMTLAIYDDPVAGAPLFTETQTVTFQAGGVFTVAIGGATPDGIPGDVPFDAPYWLGVSIQGFNGGNELTPRYELRSVPYSLRSEHAVKAENASYADDAGLADSSKGSARSEAALYADSSRRSFLSDSTGKIPALIGGNQSRQRIALLDIADTRRSNGMALHLSGDRYALVTDGVDSTARHYVTSENAGPGTHPDRGGLYQDNVPIAWGVISSSGAILSDFGIASVTLQSDQTYDVTLDNAVGTIPGTTPAVPAFSPQITIGGATFDAAAVPMWTYKRLPTGGYDPAVIVVRFLIVQGQNVPAPFSILVFGR